MDAYQLKKIVLSQRHSRHPLRVSYTSFTIQDLNNLFFYRHNGYEFFFTNPPENVAMYHFESGQPYTMPTAIRFREPRPWEEGGRRYGKNTSLTLTFLTDAKLAQRLLPEPFHLGEEPLVSVSYVVCEDVDWLAEDTTWLVSTWRRCSMEGSTVTSGADFA